LSGPAADQCEYKHAERVADSEGAEEAMTDEEKLGGAEQPVSRPRLEYEEGFKRIYIVLVVCGVALLSLMSP
jgi:hypothetical protein